MESPNNTQFRKIKKKIGNQLHQGKNGHHEDNIRQSQVKNFTTS